MFKAKLEISRKFIKLYEQKNRKKEGSERREKCDLVLKISIGSGIGSQQEKEDANKR
jgi:hypothetical protein